VRTITLVSVLLCSAVALADEAESKKLFEEGLALQAANKFPDACAKFQKSYDVDTREGRPAPGTRLNLGDCAEREGQLRKAWLLFDTAAQEYDRRAKAAEGILAKDPNSADGKQALERANAGKRLARERADALSPKLAKVVVRIVEPTIDGYSVRIGDRAVSPAAEIVELLDAGNVQITASAPGREPFTTNAKAESGKQVVVEIPALRVIGGGKPDKSGGVAGVRNKKRVRIAYGLGGGGLVLLGVSTVIGLGAKSKYDDAKAMCPAFPECPPGPFSDIESAGSRADLATVLGIGGIGLVAAGAVVYFTAPREGVVVTPTASPGGGGVMVRGRF
jgi:tetratricopeptide (TPR) repeat protein